MRFADNVKAARQELGWTAQELAQQTKLSLEIIEDWEAGKAYPHMDEMKLLSRALNTNAEKMIADEDMADYIDYLTLSGAGRNPGSSLGDIVLVAAILLGLTPGFMTGDFILGAMGVILGLCVGIVVRKLINKKVQNNK